MGVLHAAGKYGAKARRQRKTPGLITDRCRSGRLWRAKQKRFGHDLRHWTHPAVLVM
jgi:hypothetical protein